MTRRYDCIPPRDRSNCPPVRNQSCIRALLRGSANPDRDYMEKIHPEKMRLSLEYVRRRSLRTDLAVLARTFAAVFRS